MTDLTKITTPFGLLDAETQEALRAHGGPYECWFVEEWEELECPGWDWMRVYRVKPQPPKPREWWIVGGCEAYEDKLDAINATFGLMRPSIVRVREVLSDD